MKWRTRVLNVACFQVGATTNDDKGRPIPDVAEFNKAFPDEASRLPILQFANRTLRVAGYAPMQGSTRDTPDEKDEPVPVVHDTPQSLGETLTPQLRAKKSGAKVAVKGGAKASAKAAVKAAPKRKANATQEQASV